ncbi:MAG: pyrroline-5-carboxylate reductase [Deltaproteobacteria bacterium]|nr:pyrroline-5-carboxylate reductase [Deltaproteobacteria bacterium]
MLTKKTIGFLGAGNLAEALIKGLLESKSVAASQLIASDRLTSRLLHLAEAYEVKVFNKNYEAVRNADIIFLTVKPNDVAGLLAEVARELGPGKLIISAAAGITTTKILEAMKAGGAARFTPVVRAMPNTPAIVGQGAVALCAGLGAREEDLKLARAVFEAVGRVIVVEDEALMDAVTGLSGSGPAYVFLFMEALAEGGVKMGLSQKDAIALSVQTVLGAARLATESKKDLLELREMVTSPGGTTVEGLKKLNEAGFKDAVIAAVEAATRRARELSGS